MDTESSDSPSDIACVGCDDTDGPFKPIDPANGIYLCEPCVRIALDSDQ